MGNNTIDIAERKITAQSIQLVVVHPTSRQDRRGCSQEWKQSGVEAVR